MIETSVYVTETPAEEMETESTTIETTFEEMVTESTTIDTSVDEIVTEPTTIEPDIDSSSLIDEVVSLVSSSYTSEVCVSDVSLYIPEYGYITGTISETHTSDVLNCLEELKTIQQKQIDLISVIASVMCLVIGAVCGLLLTLHIKRR